MLLQQTKLALGSETLLTVVAESREEAEMLLVRLWEEIEAFEERFSRFRTDSELTYVNHNAGRKSPITATFRDVLLATRRFARDTGGLYNPFILPALQQAGYKGSWPQPDVFDPRLDFSKRQIHDISALKVGKDWAMIPANGALDFGGIGKGYLLDKLAALARQSCQGFWFSLGGDIIAQGFDDAGQPWKLGVQAVEHPDMILGQVENKGGQKIAIATSGITKRRGKKGDRDWNHLIDPRTGQSTDSDILTATVVGPQACEADVLAGCVVLLGSQKARVFLEARQLAALIQTNITTAYSQGLLLVGEAITLTAGER